MPQDPDHHPEIHAAIATCAHHPGFCAGDDEALADQLRTVGVRTSPAVWNDPAVDWSAFDAVLIRTTWDYTEQLDAFLDWTRRVEAETRLFNPSRFAETNLNKTYLKALGDAAVPTIWIPRGAEHDPSTLALMHGWDRVAMKPAVGAGAENLLITDASDARALRDNLDTIHKRCDAMLQPLVESVRTKGELSIVMIDGEITHAVRKTPAPGDHRVQIEFGGQYHPETPPPAAREAARAAARLWENQGDGVPLYARIDLLEPEPGVFWIIEVELVEPELFFPLAPEAGAALGRALRRRLELEVDERLLR